MSALPPKADIRRRQLNVCLGPIPDITNQKLARRLGHDPLVNHSYLNPWALTSINSVSELVIMIES
jgi:hypothetical protein